MPCGTVRLLHRPVCVYLFINAVVKIQAIVLPFATTAAARIQHAALVAALHQ